MDLVTHLVCGGVRLNGFFIVLFYFLFLCILFLVLLGLSGWAFSSYNAQASHRGGFSCLGTQAPRHVGSVVVVLGLSCPKACGILIPDPGLNPCLLC